MRVVMVGSGNTASVLSMVIAKAGHVIVQVASRKLENASKLAGRYAASAVSLTAPEFATADIYILALHDTALEHLENYPALKNKLVVHTAGSVSIEVLKKVTQTYGVLYPLQTLSKNISHIPEIPFLIDGNTQETQHRILGFAKSLSKIVIEAGDSERLNYNLSAVFVSNFTNHLYALAESFCRQERIDFKNLIPLINEINTRVSEQSPFMTQTGPAIRDDIFTLNKHLQTLNAFPELKYIYLKLSESIIKMHGK
jgi:predicted short-subunit dehydrogenase-like oxidoreductase (DUF2520 family)